MSQLKERYDLIIKATPLLLSFLALAAPAFAGDKIDLPPGWKTPMGPKGTALEAAKRIFPGATLDREDKLVLASDKLLRMPGTSKDRAELPEADGANPPQIIATVTLTHAPKEFTEGCKGKPQPRVEVFENRYRWDPVKKQYRDAGGNFDRLDKWNERNV